VVPALVIHMPAAPGFGARLSEAMHCFSVLGGFQHDPPIRLHGVTTQETHVL
jgi:hypothetical protein